MRDGGPDENDGALPGRPRSWPPPQPDEHETTERNEEGLIGACCDRSGENRDIPLPRLKETACQANAAKATPAAAATEDHE